MGNRDAKGATVQPSQIIQTDASRTSKGQKKKQKKKQKKQKQTAVEPTTTEIADFDQNTYNEARNLVKSQDDAAKHAEPFIVNGDNTQRKASQPTSDFEVYGNEHIDTTKMDTLATVAIDQSLAYPTLDPAHNRPPLLPSANIENKINQPQTLPLLGELPEQQPIQHEPCQRTVFEKNGIVFGHQTDAEPPSQSVASYPRPYQNDYPASQFNGQDYANFDSRYMYHPTPNVWYDHQSQVHYQNNFPYPMYHSEPYPSKPSWEPVVDCPTPYPTPYPADVSIGGYPGSSTESPVQKDTPRSSSFSLPARFDGANSCSQNDKLQDTAISNGHRTPRVASSVASSVAAIDPPVSNIQSKDKADRACVAPIRASPLDSITHGQLELEPVSDHLLKSFKSWENADYQITLNSSIGRFYSTSYPLHAVIGSRSHNLNCLMKNTSHGRSPRLISIVAGRFFMQPKAFEVALQNLYGLPLVSQPQLDSQFIIYAGYNHQPPACTTSTSSRIARMDFALCYIASGAFLANTVIMEKGIQLAVSTLGWETVETALKFAISPSEFMVSCIDGASPDQLSSSDSSDDGIGRGHNRVLFQPYPAYSEGLYHSGHCLNRELTSTWAPKLLRNILEFVAYNIPWGFEFDVTAQSPILPSRFSSLPTSNDWFISSVQFGDFTPSPPNPNREVTVVSAILVSLPFKAVKKLFKLMRSAGTMNPKIVEDVVYERERRRLRALRTLDLKGLLHSGTFSQSEALGWEEFIRPSHDNSYGGVSIGKIWKGIETGPVVFDSGNPPRFKSV